MPVAVHSSLHRPPCSTFFESPQVPGFQGSGWYGLGVIAVNTQEGLYWYHDGGCPGTVANAVHRANGYDWAMVLNTRSKHASEMVNELINSIDDLIGNGITDPGHDLYEDFPSKEL